MFKQLMEKFKSETWQKFADARTVIGWKKTHTILELDSPNLELGFIWIWVRMLFVVKGKCS